MHYVSVADAAKSGGKPERTMRNYCACNKIPGAFLSGKTWNIPENAKKPFRLYCLKGLLISHMVEMKGIEPSTSALRTLRSPN